MRHSITRDEGVLICIVALFFGGINLSASFFSFDTRYTTGSPLFSAVLLTGIAACFLCFSHVYKIYNAKLTNRDYVLLLGVTAGVFALYGLFPALSIQDPHTADPHDIIPALFLLPKWLDIILQQLCLVVAVYVVHERTSSLQLTTAWSVCIALLFHTALFVHHSFWFATLATIASCAAALVFPYAVLRVRNGVVYTYSAHWVFYLVLAIFY
jgi:hypothetical protein